MIVLGRGNLDRIDPLRDPDAAGEAELDEDLRESRPKKTVAAEEYQWGRWLWWCGKTCREHMPDREGALPHEVTRRLYIKAHLTMRRDRKTGLWLPYAYSTVEQGIYLLSSIYERLGRPGFVSKKVADQLAWYAHVLRKRNIPENPHQSVAITPAESVAIARQADLRIISGLRSATAFRLLFDTGMRVGELLWLTWRNVRWVDENRVVLHIAWSKAKEPRNVHVQAPPPNAANLDVDPFLLFRTWFELCRDRDHIHPDLPVFPAVHPARPRRDGRVSGTLTDQVWEYQDVHREWTRLSRGAGVDVDRFTGQPRVATIHGNRAGHITRAGLLGVRQEIVARGTGHSLSSHSFWRYFRADLQWGDGNPGYVIRSQQEPTRPDQEHE